MPDDIKQDFIEAALILENSPRGCSALSRLCVQKLCKFLGEEGKNIDQDIAELVKKGLDSRLQKAFDIVRIVGNESVHPGLLDLRDDRETALQLLGLVNAIVDTMISQPARIQTLYSKLPEGKRLAIEKRDKSNT